MTETGSKTQDWTVGNFVRLGSDNLCLPHTFANPESKRMFVTLGAGLINVVAGRSVNFGARTVEFGTAELHKVSVSFHAFKHIANRFSNSSACALQRVIR